MTTTRQQAELLLAQVLEVQDRMAQHRALAQLHEVVEGYFTVRGTTVVQCSCGEWIDRPDEESQFAYAIHVADALHLKVRLGRAA